jgi:cyanophycinase-like exopeptidase
MTDDAKDRGTIALHGGGEFKRGDEPFLDALLAAAQRARAGNGREGPLKVAVVPSAAARERPQLAARHGVDAFRRAGERMGIVVDAEARLVLDRDSAADAELAGALGSAHVIHFPGGHPDLIPVTLDGTPAWAAIRAAVARGAVLAGASAGAMGLADRTWTPFGWRDGLGMVHGLIVVPHFQMFDLSSGWESAIAELDAAGLGRLGLDERTGVLSDGDGRSWDVIGQGRAHWFPVRGEPIVAGHGEKLRFPD